MKCISVTSGEKDKYDQAYASLGMLVMGLVTLDEEVLAHLFHAFSCRGWSPDPGEVCSASCSLSWSRSGCQSAGSRNDEAPGEASDRHRSPPSLSLIHI